MENIFEDLLQAFGYAASSDPLYVLVPLLVVGLIQGLVTDGPVEAAARALTGLFWLAVSVFVLDGLMSDDRLSPAAWQDRFGMAWDELMRLRLMETLGFYLLMLAVILVVSLVRGIVRR
ncbi:MAG: hypothetical protein HRU11_08060 [Parvularculaceae bacterium]|nr:hypothetical protein [Parvularculaceae bacterium]